MKWQSSFRDSLKSSTELKQFLGLKNIATTKFNIFIPVKFGHKIKAAGPGSALWEQFIPNDDENLNTGLEDPIGDIKNSKGSGIIHRYESRILFTPTTICPILCRYCFRKNELSSNDDIFKQNLSCLKDYLHQNPKINEVILTGGDPLILTESKLSEITDILIQAKIKFFRIHTRTPIIMPERITNELINYFNEITSKFTKIIFILHTNHISEIDQEVELALNKLRECRIDKKVQSVLLKGVNNNSNALIELYYKLLDCDFTPYYLHHPDQVRGAMHFYLPLDEGRLIYLKLRDRLPGWAIPHYIIDHPEGRGKQNAFNPENIQFSGKLLDKNGQLQVYNSL